MRPDRWTLPLALLLLASGATPASSEPPPGEDPYSRNGWYLGLGGYYQREYSRDTCENGSIPGEGCIDGFRPDSSGGVAGHAGYRFHRYAAADLQFEWVKDALEDDFDESAYVATINLKAYLPWRRLQTFALLGGGYMRAPVPDRFERDIRVENGIAFRFGGGFELYASEHWALLAEASWVQPLPLNDLDKVPYLSAGGGFQYRF